MKLQRLTLLGVAWVVLSQAAFGQGFVNLNFEQATITPTPVGGWSYPANPSQAFPGWTVGGPNTVVMYNDLSLGSPAVALMGPNFPNSVNYLPLQGSYSVLLQYFGSVGMGLQPPTLSQIGMIPAGSKSISFLTSSDQSNMRVSMNGTDISLVSLGNGRLAGDISAFAGSTAQLTFSTPSAFGWFFFDDIQFSPTTVPEPETYALYLLGFGALLGWQGMRNKTA